MRVIEKNDQLIIRTSLLAGCFIVLFGLVFALIGLGALWLGDRATALTCIRLEATEVRCEIKQTVLGLPVRQIEVTNPREAVIQDHDDSDGGTTYRVALVTTSAVVPLTEIYTGDSVRSQAAQINQFLKTPGQHDLVIYQPPIGWIFLFPICFTGFGVLVFLGLKFTTYTLDRRRDTLTIQQVSLRGTQQQAVPLAGLTAEVYESRDSDGDATYTVRLRLATGRLLDVGLGGSSQAAQQKLADRIAAFVRPGARLRYIDTKD